MNARTPALSPVLPQLISSLAAQLRRAEQRLAAATSADADSTFVVADEQWRKGPRPDRRRRSFTEHDVTAIDRNGRRVDLSKAEDRAFWTWAIVEVLRHTGVRIEELLELTHLSLRPFRKPDGQIIPLLQIAPSKSDVERVLPRRARARACVVPHRVTHLGNLAGHRLGGDKSTNGAAGIPVGLA
jgi:hypothetical protein